MDTPKFPDIMTPEEFDAFKEQNQRLVNYAFPGKQHALIGDQEMEVNTPGLTKREYFAAMAMHGILSNNNGIGSIENIAEVVTSDAIYIADKLLKKLSNGH